MVARKRSRKSKARKAAKKTSKSKARKKSPESNKAMRLTFSYEGKNVKLVSQQRIEMIVPSSDVLKGYGQKGFWAELKSERDKTLYRTVLHNPTKNDAEVFPETPGGEISRQPAPKRKGVFVVVVPDTAKGEEVILRRSAPETKGPMKGIRALASKPAEEILRFKLKK
ncbi:MAG TPA: hypothetical protein VN724_05365 [Pyrinomonadaceae bacterium]|nr:hypothetical protein [Pyrinomonadaceae bacterium]